MVTLLCNLLLGNNPTFLGSSLTSALARFNFNRPNKIDYEDALNSRQVPRMLAPWLRSTSSSDVLFFDVSQVLMKIYSLENAAFTGVKLATDSTRFSGKDLQ